MATDMTLNKLKQTGPLIYELNMKMDIKTRPPRIRGLHFLTERLRQMVCSYLQLKLVFYITVGTVV